MTRTVKTVWVALSQQLTGHYARTLHLPGWKPFPLHVSRAEPLADTGGAAADRSLLSRALRAREHDVVLLTSAHAARAVDPATAAGWSAACVGAATAAAAKNVGFDVVFSGTGTAEEMAHGLVAQAPGLERILWIRGQEALTAGAAVLRDAGVVVDEVIAYLLAARPDLRAAAASAPAPDAVLVGSPRGVDILRDALGGALPEVAYLTLGPTTEAHLRGLGVADIHVAALPGPDGVAALLR